MFEDKVLTCKDCGTDFIFTAGEQEFYSEKGFQNEPTRCKACRDARKSQFNRGNQRKAEKCLMQYALNVEKKLKFLLNPL